MRELSLTTAYVTTFISQNEYGEQVGGYTNLKEIKANIQYMTNEVEFKTYGEITNSVITIRTNNLPNIAKGDYIYLSKPTKKGTFRINDTTYEDYGVGEFIVESVKPNYIGTSNVKNRTYITARKVKQ